MEDNYLINKNYIQIKNMNITSYGGNQNWCKNKKLQKIGCGVIAMVDVSLYLAEQSPRMMTDSIRSINKPNGLYNKNDYLEYVKRFYSHYVWMVVGKGMTGIGLMSAMNRYFFANHIDLHATWKIMLSSENMMTDIRHLIRNNKPVIISVGPNTPNVFGKQGIRLYLDKDGELVESQKDQVKSHYVVVTGVKTINNQEYLIISSWGKKYYLNYREYREYIDKVGGKITSSLLYIKGTLS